MPTRPQGNSKRPPRRPKHNTFAGFVFDYVRLNREFTIAAYKADCFKKWAIAEDGPCRTLGDLRRRGLVRYEYCPHYKEYTITWAYGDDGGVL